MGGLIKLTGCILIMLSAGGLGFFKAYTIKKRRSELEALKSMLTMLKGEIKYFGEDINMALENVAKRHEGAMKCFINEVSKGLKAEEGKSVDEVWAEAMPLLKEGYLEKEDYEVISGLGRSLGKSDRDTQINLLEGFLERLDTLLKSVEKSEEQKCTAAKSLGIAGGIFIVILII